MRVVISRGHLELNEKLAKESNLLARRFNNTKYSKIKSIDSLLVRRDISVEAKKAILLKKLHDLALSSFSISKKGFGKKSLDSMRQRLHNLRKLIIKLRGINYYLETAFLEDLKLSKISVAKKSQKLKCYESLAKGDLNSLEYSAYSLIGKAVVLDKRLLKKYSVKEKNVLQKEKSELKSLGMILGKESVLLEHLEAKIPPPAYFNANLMKEPVFTHWVSRVFALLAYLEHIYSREKLVFSQLKKNSRTKSRISRKICQIMDEQSKLLRIMEQKAFSMEKFNISNSFRKEVHKLTAAAAL